MLLRPALLLHVSGLSSEPGTQVPTAQKLALDTLWNNEGQQHSSHS